MLYIYISNCNDCDINAVYVEDFLYFIQPQKQKERVFLTKKKYMFVQFLFPHKSKVNHVNQ